MSTKKLSVTKLFIRVLVNNRFVKGEGSTISTVKKAVIRKPVIVALAPSLQVAFKKGLASLVPSLIT